MKIRETQIEDIFVGSPSLMKETFEEYIKRLRTENRLILTQHASKLNLDSECF